MRRGALQTVRPRAHGETPARRSQGHVGRARVLTTYMTRMPVHQQEIGRQSKGQGGWASGAQ